MTEQEFADMKALVDLLQKRSAAWEKLAKGRALLLVAYRLGRQPSEKAFKLIDQARTFLGDEVVP